MNIEEIEALELIKRTNQRVWKIVTVYATLFDWLWEIKTNTWELPMDKTYSTSYDTHYLYALFQS